MIQRLLPILLLALFGCSDVTTEKIDHSSNFHWDFSKPRTYLYRFEQKTTSSMDWSEDRGPRNMIVEAEGQLKVGPAKNNKAAVSIIDVKSRMYDQDELEDEREPMTATGGNMVIPDMNPDGSFDAANGQDFLFHTLIPLPQSYLEVGKTATIKTSMPFNAAGSALSVKGTVKLTYDRQETFLGRQCAVLKGVIDVSDLNVPEGVDGEYTCEQKGTGTYYFDLKEHCYVGADIELTSRLYGKSSFPGETEVSEIRQTSENSYSIRLLKIKE